MASMSEASQPAASSARRVAWRARSEAPTPGSTQRRSWTPVRWRIHASLVSMHRSSSALVTTRSGTQVPRAAMAARGMSPPWAAVATAAAAFRAALDVEVLRVQRVLLDELAALVDRVAHEHAEDLVGLDAVVD